MSGKFLLDSNIVIALFANDPLVIVALRTVGEVSHSSINSSLQHETSTLGK